MAYDAALADRVREYLLAFPKLRIEEKEMFRGLTFMINEKMCISVSGNNLMCRYDPALHEEVAERNGHQPMIMKGKNVKAIVTFTPLGLKSGKDFTYWVNLCLNYNDKAKASKKSKLR